MSTQNSQFKRTEAGNSLAQSALTKAIFYFNDGNTRTFHSRDRLKSNSGPSREVGINRLKKLGYKWKASIQNAFIYDLQTGEELFRFKDGQWT